MAVFISSPWPSPDAAGQPEQAPADVPAYGRRDAVEPLQSMPLKDPGITMGQAAPGDERCHDDHDDGAVNGDQVGIEPVISEQASKAFGEFHSFTPSP